MNSFSDLPVYSSPWAKTAGPLQARPRLGWGQGHKVKTGGRWGLAAFQPHHASFPGRRSQGHAQSHLSLVLVHRGFRYVSCISVQEPTALFLLYILYPECSTQALPSWPVSCYHCTVRSRHSSSRPVKTWGRVDQKTCPI